MDICFAWLRHRLRCAHDSRYLPRHMHIVYSPWDHYFHGELQTTRKAIFHTRIRNTSLHHGINAIIESKIVLFFNRLFGLISFTCTLYFLILGMLTHGHPFNFFDTLWILFNLFILLGLLIDLKFFCIPTPEKF